MLQIRPLLQFSYVYNKDISLFLYISIDIYSDTALSAMPDDSGDIINTRGVTAELWKTLDELWGSEITSPLRKLRLVRNHRGPYHQCSNPPTAPRWYKEKTNPKMDLLEARYGSIKDISSNKPSVWFVVRHRKEQDQSRARISDKCHLSICIQWLTANEQKTEYRESFSSEDFAINIIKPTTHGDDRYVLLQMILEPTDWNKALPHLEAPPSGRIGPDERLVVHLQDSLPNYNYRSAIWQADVNW